jgi:glycosyltransferase involved in cell wall biosynthesis
MKKSIIFWQRSLSPHMTDLAGALVSYFDTVTFVVEQELPLHRYTEGMRVSLGKGLQVLKYSDLHPFESVVMSMAQGSFNICQGIRSNGSVAMVQEIFLNNKINFLPTFEQLRGGRLVLMVKRLVYRLAFFKYRNVISAILAIGSRSKDQLLSIGVKNNLIHDFAYFIDIKYSEFSVNHLDDVPSYINNYCNFVYIGRLDKNKNVKLILRALIYLNKLPIKFHVIGAGPEKDYLESFAREADLDVIWYGPLPMSEAHQLLAKMDCLILPSFFDGWGVVASEALLSGVPVIVSDGAGVCSVVEKSPFGLTFESGDLYLLIKSIKIAYSRHKNLEVDHISLREWSTRISSESGARYLVSILESVSSNKFFSVPAPWCTGSLQIGHSEPLTPFECSCE